MSQGKQIVGHSLIYALGNLSRQLVSFIMLPIYTQYLTPADYGVVGLLIFLVSLIELLFGGHMFQAVPKYYFDYEAPSDRRAVVSSAFSATFLISGTSALALAAVSDKASFLIFGTDQYSLYVAMFSVLILTHALENYSLIYIRILKKPWTFIAFNLAKLGIQLSLNIITVVFLELGILGIAISAMVSSILIASILSIYTLTKTGITFNKPMFVKLFRFSWPLWISGLAGLYIGSSNRYFIRIFSDLDAVGLFELAAKFGAVIPMLVWLPFSQYWQTERFNIVKQADPIPVFQNVFLLVSTVLVSSATGLSILSPSVIAVMSDEAFHAASSAVPYLAFGGVFQSLTIYNNFSFMVTENTTWITKNTFLTAGIITVLYILLVPLFGFIGAAQAFMAATGVQFLIIFFYSRRYFDMELPLRYLGIQLTIAFSAIVFSFVHQDSGFLETLLVAILASTLVAAPLLLHEPLRQILKKQLVLITSNR